MATLAIVGMPPFSLFQSEFADPSRGFRGGHSVSGVLFDPLPGRVSSAGVPTARRRDGPGADPGDAALGSVPVAQVFADRRWPCLVVTLGFWVPGPLFALDCGRGRMVRGGYDERCFPEFAELASRCSADRLVCSTREPDSAALPAMPLGAGRPRDRRVSSA